ncbi:MAG TPA: macro domain-containing protein [Gemmatimonadaceae bacterium]
MIDVRVDDIAFFEGDAIVRPVNSMLQATTPVMRRLEQAAGPKFPGIVRMQHPLPVGAAVVTGAGDLPVELLVHGVVSSPEERVTRATVRLALMSAMQRAVAFEIKTIAIAPFGLGAGNLDIDDSADVMVSVLSEHMRRAAFPTTVTIVVESELEEHALRTRMRSQE